MGTRLEEAGERKAKGKGTVKKVKTEIRMIL
jgi:hypothetical protein